jgi:hypothetical protein
MAENICPVCGKENSEEASECLYCGAFLTSPLDDPSRKPASESMDDILASLRGFSGAGNENMPPADETEPQPSEDLLSADFLDRLRDMAGDQPSSLDLQADTGDDSIPDWLKDLQGWKPPDGTLSQDDNTELEPDNPVFQADENTLPSWLSAVEENNHRQAEEVEFPELPGDDPQAQALADRLAAFQEDQAGEAPSDELSGGQPAPFIDLPPVAEESEPEIGGQLEEDLALSALMAERLNAALGEQPETSAVEPETGSAAFDETEYAGGEEIVAAEPGAAEPGADAAEAIEDEEFEAFPVFSQFAPEAEIEPEALIEPESTFLPEAEPEFVPEAEPERQTGPEPEPQEEPEIVFTAETEAQPEPVLIWETESEPEPAVEPEPETKVETQPEPEPVFASEIEPEPEAQPETGLEAEPVSELEPLPDLFAESAPLPETEPAPDLAAETLAPEPAAEYPGDSESRAASESEDLTEWLGKLQAGDFPPVFDLSELKTKPDLDDDLADGAETGEAGAVPHSAPPFVNGDLSSWLEPAEEEPTEDADASQTEEQPDSPEPLPEWMQDMPAEAAEPAPPAAEEGLEAPEPEPVPDWLAGFQAGALAPDEPYGTPEILEDDGPLAGIPGILPAINAAGFYRKPPLYSSQVLANEQQTDNAAKLENLVNAEKETVIKKSSRRGIPQRLWRALIGVLLIALLAVPLFAPAGTIFSPTVSPQSAPDAAFIQALDSLPDGATVLVAVEYAPGYDGELGSAGAGLFQMLMERGAHVAVVSTNTSAALLAENLKSAALQTRPELAEQYSQRDWYINLGYLPGEVLSLQELAANPRQAVQYGLGAGLENRWVWDSAGLIDIYNVSDFDMLVLITDTVENGKAWVEQVRPSAVDVPFLVISSAQAAPILQAYRDSGQVQALISGLSGGLSLQDGMAAESSLAYTRTAYPLGVIAVSLLMLIAIFAAVIRLLFARKQPGQEVT